MAGRHFDCCSSHPSSFVRWQTQLMATALCTPRLSLLFLVMAATTARCTNMPPLWAQRAAGAPGDDPLLPQLTQPAASTEAKWYVENRATAAGTIVPTAACTLLSVAARLLPHVAWLARDLVRGGAATVAAGSTRGRRHGARWALAALAVLAPIAVEGRGAAAGALARPAAQTRLLAPGGWAAEERGRRRLSTPCAGALCTCHTDCTSCYLDGQCYWYPTSTTKCQSGDGPDAEGNSGQSCNPSCASGASCFECSDSTHCTRASCSWNPSATPQCSNVPTLAPTPSPTPTLASIAFDTIITLTKADVDATPTLYAAVMYRATFMAAESAALIAAFVHAQRAEGLTTIVTPTITSALALYNCVMGQCRLMPDGMALQTCNAACHPSAAAITIDAKFWDDASCSGTPSLDDKFRNVGATCSAGDVAGGISLEYTGNSCTSGGKLSIYDSNDCTGTFYIMDVPAGEPVQPCSPGGGSFHELSCSGGTPATGAPASGLPLDIGVAVLCVASLALAGVWFARKRHRQEASAKERGHAQASFLQATDQDLDAHYSAM